MAPCLIAMRFVPDDNHESRTLKIESARSDSQVCDSEVSDREELADLKRGVGMLVVLAMAPLLISLVAYCLKPELLRIDITPVTIEHHSDVP